MAPGMWNTDLNEYDDPSSSTICALMAELDAVKVVWAAFQRFPDGAKNAFSPSRQKECNQYRWNCTADTC